VRNLKASYIGRNGDGGTRGRMRVLLYARACRCAEGEHARAPARAGRSATLSESGEQAGACLVTVYSGCLATCRGTSRSGVYDTSRSRRPGGWQMAAGGRGGEFVCLVGDYIEFASSSSVPPPPRR